MLVLCENDTERKMQCNKKPVRSCYEMFSHMQLTELSSKSLETKSNKSNPQITKRPSIVSTNVTNSVCDETVRQKLKRSSRLYDFLLLECVFYMPLQQSPNDFYLCVSVHVTPRSRRVCICRAKRAQCSITLPS